MKTLGKKGDVWISVVMYTAIGVIALTLILSAGLPMIQKMKDKNTVAQTKNLMTILDENIRAVIGEGPGSRRFLSPFEIKAGDFYIDGDNDRLYWNLKTTAKMVEPRYDSNGKLFEPEIPVFREGSIEIFASESIIVDEYILEMGLDYKDFSDLRLDSEFSSPFKGLYSLTIENTGAFSADGRPIVALKLAL